MKNCTRCASCCTNKDMPIALYPQEILAIKPRKDFAGLIVYNKNNIFSKSYCFKIFHCGKVKKVYYGIIYDKKGRCPFLQARNKCRIYLRRPTGCLSFYCRDRLTIADINRHKKRYREQTAYILKVREWNRNFKGKKTISDFEKFTGSNVGIKTARTQNYL